VAATFIVLEVEGMDEAAASRIDSMLAGEYSEGIVSAVADTSTGLLTVLTRADSGMTAGAVIEELGGLGFEAREADEATYASAEPELLAHVLTVPAAGDRDEGASDVPNPDVLLQSLESSLEPLRSRFSEGKGGIRFVALLSPT